MIQPVVSDLSDSSERLNGLLLRRRIIFQCRGHNVMISSALTLYCFTVFFYLPLSLFHSFCRLSSTFLFRFNFPAPVSIWFTFEMCPSFKWKQIKASSLSPASGIPLQLPTFAGLRSDLVSTAQQPRLWLSVVPEGRRQLWAAFSLISSELEELPASLLLSQVAEKKKRMEDGRICKLYHHQRRGRGVSHQLSVKECSPSPTHTGL